jgi:hypothetical protein
VDVIPYVVTQVIAGTAAAAVLYLIASGKHGFHAKNNVAANGYGDHSPSNYGLLSALVIEVVLTAFFLYVILGATDGRAPVGFAPIAIGLALTLIHLMSIPGHQHQRQPGPLDRCRLLRRQRRTRPTLVVLARATRRRDHRRLHLRHDHRRTQRRRTGW